MLTKQGELLTKVNSVSDLKKLNLKQLPQLCEEIREFIIDIVSHNPGHLGANLGTIELTVAIHYVFNVPEDKVIFDVGHQAYTHKILTGRKDIFFTNRKYKGISGYPKMSESDCDAFGTGHSSTSISATLGMAIASTLSNDNTRQHLAVIGDGSMTGGIAFEALNHAGVSKTNLLVILNDNGIAIDKNVGALKEYFTDISTSKFYNKLKGNIWNITKGAFRRYIGKFLDGLKAMIFKDSNLFESLNFRYFGPVDGHDVIRLVKIFEDLKIINGPKLLHCITVKGKGYQVAEEDQTKFHAPGHFDKDTGEIIDVICKGKPPKYQYVFGKTLLELAENNKKIVGVTPAMLSGCSMSMMMEKFPERTFDVGIAEQHAVTFSAGLATQGYIPFCNIYSSFLQRAYDQIIHDVALQKLHVVFCIDRGGLVGEDGATHHGSFDLSYLRAIPNMIISSPLNEVELRSLLFTALNTNMPFAIRYPRSSGVMVDWEKEFAMFEIGKGQKLKDGNDVAIISIGHHGNYAMEAAVMLSKENISAAVYDMRFLKPIDEELLHEIFKKFPKIITVEDGTIIGGLGTAVTEFMVDYNYQSSIKKLGIPDNFVEQGSLSELYAECGYDVDGIVKAVKQICEI
jgi:1-deoxy-D-xylulose-5-phosphate synthase